MTKSLAAFCLLITAAVSVVHSQERYWNPTTASANWDTTSAIWGPQAGGPYNVKWNNGSVAHLDSTVAGGSTATLTESISTGNIFFSGQFTIAKGTGGFLTVANGATITGATPTSTLSINTQILGASTLTFTGGTVHLNANNSGLINGIQVNANTDVTVGTASAGLSGALGGNVSLNAATSTISFESTQTYNNVVSGTGQLTVVSPSAGSTTLTLTQANTLTGPVVVSDRSTLALANNGITTSGSISSASQISLFSSATLDVSGHTASTWTLQNPQTLSVRGTTPTTGGRILGPSRIEGTLRLGATPLAPSSILRQEGGTMTLVGGSTASSRSTYELNLTNWTGATPGSDFSQILGVGGADLDLSQASSANQIRLDIRGVNLTNFNSSVAGSWVIADFSAGNASGGVIGFSADKFLIDTSNFGHNLNGGTFFVTTDLNSNQVILNFQPVPEPAWVLAMGSAGLVACRVVRRRFRAAHDPAPSVPIG